MKAPVLESRFNTMFIAFSLHSIKKEASAQVFNQL